MPCSTLSCHVQSCHVQHCHAMSNHVMFTIVMPTLSCQHCHANIVMPTLSCQEASLSCSNLFMLNMCLRRVASSCNLSSLSNTDMHFLLVHPHARITSLRVVLLVGIGFATGCSSRGMRTASSSERHLTSGKGMFSF